MDSTDRWPPPPPPWGRALQLHTRDDPRELASRHARRCITMRLIRPSERFMFERAFVGGFRLGRVDYQGRPLTPEAAGFWAAMDAVDKRGVKMAINDTQMGTVESYRHEAPLPPPELPIFWRIFWPAFLATLAALVLIGCSASIAGTFSVGQKKPSAIVVSEPSPSPSPTAAPTPSPSGLASPMVEVWERVYPPSPSPSPWQSSPR